MMTKRASKPQRDGGGGFLEDALINLSHELRNPLAAIKGNATMAIRHERRLTRAERQAVLAEISLACDRMEMLIDHTLHAALVLRGDITLHRESVDLVALTRQVIESYTANETVDPMFFVLEVRATPTVWGDVLWLARAMTHLLDNARRYAPAADQATIAIGTLADQAIWQVQDHGMGIHPDDLPLIFTPFYRAERDRTRSSSGIGLGLALCQRIIALHGGTIEVASSSSQGSQFQVTLPLL